MHGLVTRPSLFVIQNGQQFKVIKKVNPRITWVSMASIFPPLHCFVCFGFVGFSPPLSQSKIIKKVSVSVLQLPGIFFSEENEKQMHVSQGNTQLN